MLTILTTSLSAWQTQTLQSVAVLSGLLGQSLLVFKRRSAHRVHRGRVASVFVLGQAIAQDLCEGPSDRA